MSSLRLLSSLLAIALVVAGCAQPEATKSAAPAPPPPTQSAVTEGNPPPPPPGAVPIATATVATTPQASASAPTLNDETKKTKADKDVGRAPAATTTAVQKPKCNCTPGDPTCNC